MPKQKSIKTILVVKLRQSCLNFLPLVKDSLLYWKKALWKNKINIRRNRVVIAKPLNSWKNKISIRRNCQKGQGMIESLILSFVLTAIAKLLLTVFWIFLSLLWMEHQLYQGILCVAQQKKEILCKQKIRQEIKKLNPLGKIKKLNIQQFQNIYKGEMLWNFYKQNFLIKQSLILSL